MQPHEKAPAPDRGTSANTREGAPDNGPAIVPAGRAPGKRPPLTPKELAAAVLDGVGEGLSAGRRSRPPSGSSGSSGSRARNPANGTQGASSAQTARLPAPSGFGGASSGPSDFGGEAEEPEDPEGASWPPPGRLPGNPPGDIERTHGDHAPPPIRSWIEGEAQALYTDPLTLLAVAMAGTSILVARRFTVAVPWGHWDLSPNGSALVVAPPGGLKSPIVDKALAPLTGLQDRFDEEHRSALAAYATQIEGLTGEDVPPPPVRKVVVLNDVTAESVQSCMGAQESAGLPVGVLLHVDEAGGWLQRLGRREGDRLVFTTFCDGQKPTRGNRQTREYMQCSRGTVSVVGGIQTGLAAACVAESSAGGKADGLIARFQWTTCPAPHRKRKDPPEVYDARDRYRAAFEAVAGVEDIDPAAVRAREAKGRLMLDFTEQAASAFRKWYADHDHALTVKQAFGSGLYAEHQAKAGAAVASWAATDHMLMVSAGQASGPIGETSVARAIAVHERLKLHAAALYGFQPGCNPLSSGAWRLIRGFQRGDLVDNVTTGQIRDKRWSDFPKIGAIVDAGFELEHLGLARMEHINRDNYTIRLNPRWIQRGLA